MFLQYELCRKDDYMPERNFKFKDINVTGRHVRIKVDMSRFEKNFQDAQKWLDNQVMTSMLPFMPRVTGTFIDNTRAKSISLAGSGIVCAGYKPHGQFLYGGKVMVDPVTGSAWARKDAGKVLTNKPLTYSNPQATPQWFETAKRRDGDMWVREVKKRAGGNNAS